MNTATLNTTVLNTKDGRAVVGPTVIILREQPAWVEDALGGKLLVLRDPSRGTIAALKQPFWPAALRAAAVAVAWAAAAYQPPRSAAIAPLLEVPPVVADVPAGRRQPPTVLPQWQITWGAQRRGPVAPLALLYGDTVRATTPRAATSWGIDWTAQARPKVVPTPPPVVADVPWARPFSVYGHWVVTWGAQTRAPVAPLALVYGDSPAVVGTTAPAQVLAQWEQRWSAQRAALAGAVAQPTGDSPPVAGASVPAQILAQWEQRWAAQHAAPVVEEVQPVGDAPPILGHVVPAALQQWAVDWSARARGPMAPAILPTAGDRAPWHAPSVVATWTVTWDSQRRGNVTTGEVGPAIPPGYRDGLNTAALNTRVLNGGQSFAPLITRDRTIQRVIAESWASALATGQPQRQVAAISATTFPTQYAGLRTYHNGAVVELCLVALADAPAAMGAVPRVRKGGVTYAVYLVETTDPNASHIYILTDTGLTKAIRRKT